MNTGAGHRSSASTGPTVGSRSPLTAADLVHPVHLWTPCHPAPSPSRSARDSGAAPDRRAPPGAGTRRRTSRRHQSRLPSPGRVNCVAVEHRTRMKRGGAVGERVDGEQALHAGVAAQQLVDQVHAATARGRSTTWRRTRAASRAGSGTARSRTAAARRRPACRGTRTRATRVSGPSAASLGALEDHLVALACRPRRRRRRC